MTIPTVTVSSTQGASAYTALQSTALSTPYSEEKASAVAVVTTTDTEIDPVSGDIVIAAKITMQSFLNGGRSQVTIARAPVVNVFENPIPLMTIIQKVGFNIYNVEQRYAAGTPGNFTLVISGDNVLSTTVITNPTP